MINTLQLVTRGIISSKFSINSEAFASELIENLEETSHKHVT